MLVKFVLHAFVGFLHTCLLAYLHVCASNKNKQTDKQTTIKCLCLYLFISSFPVRFMSHIFSDLIVNQVAMSEEERDRIFEEHEKNLAEMESR